MKNLRQWTEDIARAGRESPPAEPWPRPVAEWLDAIRTTHGNGLLVAPSSMTDRVIEALRPVLREPFLEQWGGTPWDKEQDLANLVLHNLTALSPREQLALFAWIDGYGRECRIIAFAPLPVFPLVEDDRFLAPLYYRLNGIYAEHVYYRS
jgi:hypothetical protein